MIHVEVDGKTVLGFDTGLNSRSFAQAKFAQFITEPGLIVNGNKVELWKASGVVEKNTMIVWGPFFEGERLDFLLNDTIRQEESLAAITRWIQVIQRHEVPLWPCAALIGKTGIFFAPPSLVRHCLLNSENGGPYVHPDYNLRGEAVWMNNEARRSPGESPVIIESGFALANPADADLKDIDGAAFTASAMLYHVIVGSPPFSAANESLLHQDIREGNFLPIGFAVPGLNSRLASAIQNALEPIEKRINRSVTGKIADGAALLGEILAVLQNGGNPLTTADLVQPLSEEDRRLLEKEKAKFLKKNTLSIRAKRFVMRNSTKLIVCLAALVITILVSYSMIKNRALRPGTAGMEPIQVIESYYDAIGGLDHQLMEACVIGKAGKDDINMVINFFVLNKMKQTYELNSPPLTISAREWKERGEGELDSQVFGVTDLHTEWLSGSKDGELRYRVDYILWVPVAAASHGFEPEPEIVETRLPLPYYRSDIVSLARKRGNWRIAAIMRD